MTKFDSILTDLCEANNYPTPGTQQSASTQNQQPGKPATGNTTAPTNTQNNAGQPQVQTSQQQSKPATTTNTNQVKLTPQQTKQLMDDFNGPAQVKSAADFQKYGINLS